MEVEDKKENWRGMRKMTEDGQGEKKEVGGEARCLVWVIVIRQLVERGELQTWWLEMGGIMVVGL